MAHPEPGGVRSGGCRIAAKLPSSRQDALVHQRSKRITSKAQSERTIISNGRTKQPVFQLTSTQQLDRDISTQSRHARGRRTRHQQEPFATAYHLPADQFDARLEVSLRAIFSREEDACGHLIIMILHEEFENGLGLIYLIIILKRHYFMRSELQQ